MYMAVLISNNGTPCQDFLFSVSFANEQVWESIKMENRQSVWKENNFRKQNFHENKEEEEEGEWWF